MTTPPTPAPGDYFSGDSSVLPAEELFELAVHRLGTVIYDDNVRKGFWDGDRNDGEAIALMHSELSEALESIRHNHPPSEKISGFTNTEEEMADAVIRIMDYCAGRGMRLGEAVTAKLAYNRSRPFKHGKQF